MHRYRFTLEFDAEDQDKAYDVAIEVHDYLTATLNYDQDTSEGMVESVYDRTNPERVGSTR